MGAGSTFSQGANTNTANPYAGTTSPYFNGLSFALTSDEEQHPV